MTIMRRLTWCAVGLVLLGGCRTAPSDDPRAGGLLGYWQHGESGYQERLDRRQTEIDATQRDGESAQSQTDQLQQQRDTARAELARQRAALADMTSELAELNQACTVLEAGTAEQSQEKQAVVEEADALQNQIADLEQDTDLLIRERQRRIAALKKELKLLRERASLLTTL